MKRQETPPSTTVQELLASLEGLVQRAGRGMPSPGRLVRCLRNLGPALQFSDEDLQLLIARLHELPARARVHLYVRLVRARPKKREEVGYGRLRSAVIQAAQRRLEALIGLDLQALALEGQSLDLSRHAALALRIKEAATQRADAILPDLALCLALVEGSSTVLRLALQVVQGLKGLPPLAASADARFGTPVVDASVLALDYRLRRPSVRKPDPLDLILQALGLVWEAQEKQTQRWGELVERGRALADQIQRLEHQVTELRGEIERLGQEAARAKDSRAVLEDKLAEEERRYGQLKHSAELLRATEKRGLLAGIERYLKHELSSLLESLGDSGSDEVKRARRRVDNVFQFLSEQRDKLSSQEQ